MSFVLTVTSSEGQKDYWTGERFLKAFDSAKHFITKGEAEIIMPNIPVDKIPEGYGNMTAEPSALGEPYKPCPKCGSDDLLLERRMNGNAICQKCGHTHPMSTWNEQDSQPQVFSFAKSEKAKQAEAEAEAEAKAN